MPRRIVTEDGTRFWITEFELPPLQAAEIRVRVAFAAPKHGTESQAISGSPFQTKQWDPEMRLFLPRSEKTSPDAVTPPKQPRGIGNMVVGEVLEVGAEVTRFQTGDRVFGSGQISEIVQASETKFRPLSSLTPVDAVCTEPGHVAFVAVRDGNIRIGDDVAVFGLGAIGLLTVQIAKAGGARHVFAVDPLPSRREYALQHGADAAFDPRAQDAAVAIKQATDRHGVDVAIETSGNGRALNDAIRCIRQCGTVVHVPWGPKDGTDLKLGEEFHHNRPTLIGSQAWEGWGNPDRSHPLWNPERAYQATIALFEAGRITGEGIVTPIVSFEEAPAILPTIFTDPSRSIKIGVLFEP
jgi:threonine dehydrogenase-like Zn-dependent dehydrogenase